MSRFYFSSFFVSQFLLFFLPVIGVTSFAEAEFIQLVTNSDVVVDAEKKSFKLKVRIENNGDESAKAVGLELPEIGETRAVAPTLAPGKSLEFETNVSFDAVGIEKAGLYTFPFRVLYRDANAFPFSAAHLSQVELPPLPSRVLSATLEGGPAGAGIEIQKSLDVAFLVKNTSEKKLLVDKASFFTSAEIVAHAGDGINFPIEIAPRGEIRVPVSLENVASIPGSSYGSAFVVSGLVGDKHFSESTSLRVVVIPETRYQRKLLIGGLVALLILVLLGRQFKSRERE
ncbi:hypothetical protein BVY02_00940 [bacterium J17]|nr:hypothetical protein BVY02_00940 [bacterium J17]